MILLALALALGGPAASEEPEAAAQEASAMLPTPFTADQIRAGMPVGRTIDWSETQSGKTTHRRWTVTAADASTVTVEFRAIDEAGAFLKGEAAHKVFTFEELRSHALFPAALATREATTVGGAIGKGPGWTYVVRSPQGSEPATVTTFTFATLLPGAPVHMVTRAADTVVHELKQVRRGGP